MAAEINSEVSVVDTDNKEVARVALPAAFAARVSEPAMFEEIMSQRATRRRGTASTKTKGKVRGGGAKPWRQKGTGRARAGSSRSPIWRGGGTVFGPSPRSYAYRLPRSARRAALRSALAMKANEKQLRLISGLLFEEPKTKRLIGVLDSLGLTSATVLLVVGEDSEAVIRSARNLPRVKALTAAGLNVEDIVRYEYLVIASDALDAVDARTT